MPGGRQTDVQVVVEEHHFARLEEIISRFQIEALDHSGFQVVRHCSYRALIDGLPNFPNHGGPVQMVEQRRHAAKSFRAKELLVMKIPVGFFKDRMSFVGNIPQTMIHRHKPLFYAPA